MFNSVISCFLRFVVNETVTLRVSSFVQSDLARQNIAKGREGIVKSLVVDGGIKVLDKDIARAGSAQRGITLGPHDAAGSTLDQSVVKGFQSTLTYISFRIRQLIFLLLQLTLQEEHLPSTTLW